jgi:hypothetical protein
MPRVNRLIRKREDTGLTVEQTLALLIGPTGDEFANDAAREAAWFLHRDELLADVNPTTRPWAYWQFEQGGKHPKHGEEAARLAELDLLTPTEKRLLTKWAREKEN